MKSHFDILEKIDEVNFRWLEAAQHVQSAKSRIEERQALSPGEYVVFDRHTQQIVAKSNLTLCRSPAKTLRQGQLPVRRITGHVLVSLRVMLNLHWTAHAVESFALRRASKITVHQKSRTRWRG